MTPEARHLLRRIRTLIAFFIVGLILSGLTAFPLLHELNLLVSWLHANQPETGSLAWWILTVRNALANTYRTYPFLGYGTDWLAFAHLVIAIFFVGPYRNPVRNIWVLQSGLIACAAVIPLALICGPIREIPFYWQLIDSSFGIIGAIPLSIALRWTRQLEALKPDLSELDTASRLINPTFFNRLVPAAIAAAIVFSFFLNRKESRSFRAPDKEAVAILQEQQALLDRALAAYNDGDAAAFFADAASSARPPATKETFDSLFQGFYKQQLGRYQSRKLARGTNPDRDRGVIVSVAKFEKADAVQLSANFVRENGALKIVQVRMVKLGGS